MVGAIPPPFRRKARLRGPGGQTGGKPVTTTIPIDLESESTEALASQLSELSHKTSLATLDALLNLVPEGDRGFLEAASRARALSESLSVDALQGLIGRSAG